MDTSTGLVAFVPAFTATAAEEEKLLKPYCGHPLLLHSLNLAVRCAEVVKTVVVSNSVSIENAARGVADIHFERSGSSVFDEADPTPFLRTWTDSFERKEGDTVRFILVLNPYYPFRNPENVMECFQRMVINGLADAIQSVFRGPLNGRTGHVENEDGFLIPEGSAPSKNTVIKSAALSIWRRESLRETGDFHVIPYEMPEYAALSFENPENERKVAALLPDPCALLR